MRAVRAEVLEVVFAAAVLVLFGSAAQLLRGRVTRTVLLTLAWLVAAVAALAWVVVALEPSRDAATAAAGITVCAAAQAGLLVIGNAAPLLKNTAASVAFLVANGWILASYGGLVNASGRVGTGFYSDRVGRRNAFAINGIASIVCLLALPTVMAEKQVLL